MSDKDVRIATAITKRNMTQKRFTIMKSQEVTQQNPYKADLGWSIQITECGTISSTLKEADVYHFHTHER